MAATDPRSRHGTQAVTVTTGGISRELGYRQLTDGTPVAAPVLEMTYAALVHLTIDCDAAKDGVPQYFTLAPGVFIQSAQTVAAASGTPTALITVSNADTAAVSLFTAKPLGVVETAPDPADNAVTISDTTLKSLITVTNTGGAGGTATVVLNAGIVIGGWK